MMHVKQIGSQNLCRTCRYLVRFKMALQTEMVLIQHAYIYLRFIDVSGNLAARRLCIIERRLPIRARHSARVCALCVGR